MKATKKALKGASENQKREAEDKIMQEVEAEGIRLEAIAANDKGPKSE